MGGCHFLSDRRNSDLCRDSEKEGRNLQKTSVTDGLFWRCKVRSGTVIEPISNPRPLPCKPLPKLGDSTGFAPVQAPDGTQRVHGCIHFLVEFVLVLKGKLGRGPTGKGDDMDTGSHTSRSREAGREAFRRPRGIRIGMIQIENDLKW